MKHESLRHLLARVHERLSKTDAIDKETRGELVTVMRDIEHKLGSAEQESGESLPALQALAVRFEVDHPDLSDALRRLVDALGKAGI
jgi:DNA-binding FadR family transcriptional regulator